MSKGQPQTLEELYAEARVDLGRGGPDLVLKWAFKHAKAAGRVAEVERRLRQAEAMETYWRLRADYQAPGEQTPSQRAGELAIQSVRASDMELGDATAIATACEHVMALARTARPVQQQERPPLRTVAGGKRA